MTGIQFDPADMIAVPHPISITARRMLCLLARQHAIPEWLCQTLHEMYHSTPLFTYRLVCIPDIRPPLPLPPEKLPIDLPTDWDPKRKICWLVKVMNPAAMEILNFALCIGCKWALAEMIRIEKRAK